MGREERHGLVEDKGGAGVRAGKDGGKLVGTELYVKKKGDGRVLCFERRRDGSSGRRKECGKAKNKVMVREQKRRLQERGRVRTDPAFRQEVLEKARVQRQSNRAKINERARRRYVAERQAILARHRELGEITRAADALIAMRKASLGRLGI